MYDPLLARFISADTVVPGSDPLTVASLDAVERSAWASGGSGPANPQNLNRYAYTLNNPVYVTDPSGHCPWCVGALLGGGIDLAVQLVTNGGDIQKVNWAQVGVSAVAGAIGVGVGAQIAKAATSVATKIALNATASAVISSGGALLQNEAQEFLTPCQFEPVDPIRAAAVGAVTGGIGAAVGETLQGGAIALQDKRIRGLSPLQRSYHDSYALIPDPNAISIYKRMYSAGGILSTTMSNSTP